MNTEKKPHYHVSAGLIRREGSYLISRRAKGTHLEGFWEFPGGKQEAEEDLRGCLQRELKEELGIEVKVGAPLLSVDHEYADKRISLHFFDCTRLRGEPSPLQCQEVRWVMKNELPNFRFPPPDRKVIEYLMVEETPAHNERQSMHTELKRRSNAMFCRNENEGCKVLTEGVLLKSLAHGEKTHLCEFRITKGGRVPEHSHPHEQTGYLISGRVRFSVGEERFEAGPGDSWCLPGNVAHAADVLEDSVMVEVFSPCREDYLV